MQLQQCFFQVALLVGLSLCSGSSFAGDIIEIVHGRPVHAGENYSKHTVGLGAPEIVCTGVIVGQNHIVTAAHCAEDVHHGKVFFGTESTNFVSRNVIESVTNPEYCKNDCGSLTSKDDHDILILKFDGDLPAGFAPVEIAAKETLVINTAIHLAGFGIDEHGDFDQKLKVAEAPFISFNGDSEFKTDETRAGSCSGDSGGPAFISENGKLRVVGITSRGDGPCRQLGIYTMLGYYSNWITEVMHH